MPLTEADRSCRVWIIFAVWLDPCRSLPALFSSRKSVSAYPQASNTELFSKLNLISCQMHYDASNMTLEQLSCAVSWKWLLRIEYPCFLVLGWSLLYLVWNQFGTVGFLMMLIRTMCKPRVFLCTSKGEGSNVSDQSSSKRESRGLFDDFEEMNSQLQFHKVTDLISVFNY